MALIIALAINNGLRSTLQRNLLGAMSHVNLMEASPGEGIAEWRELIAKIEKLPHVVAASPALYSPIFMSGPLLQSGAMLKGIDPQSERQVTDTLRNLKEGSLERLKDTGGLPGIIMGTRLAESVGMLLDSVVTVMTPHGELTPFGMRPNVRRFRVVGTFESGFYEIDNNWAFTSLAAAQEALSLPDVVNQIEIKVDDIYLAVQVGEAIEKIAAPRYTTTNWMERNRQLLGALRMERIVTVITIGLIQLVAALNILITLVMMVMEKYRDIAILMSMGARREQIRRIFIMQGVLIGVAGSAIGLVAGYTLSYFAEKYRWVRLDEAVYSISYVPFDPRPFDAVWVAAAAIGVSFLATIYPARSATRIAPAEVLRYE
jgi:lipoprotein-releasing system permease protein